MAGDEQAVMIFPPLPSRSQRDALGERLKADLSREAVDEFHELLLMYQGPLEVVQARLAANGYRTSAPRLKSIPGVRMKLQRDETTLAGMRDIAGCRVLCTDLEQVRIRDELLRDLPGARLVKDIDTVRQGYRAVHVEAVIDGRRVEVQLRSDLQHRWAELAEVVGDLWGKDFRYGGTATSSLGQDVLVVGHRLRNLLIDVSDQISQFESARRKYVEAEAKVRHLMASARRPRMVIAILRHERGLAWSMLQTYFSTRWIRRSQVEVARGIHRTLDAIGELLEQMRSTL